MPPATMPLRRALIRLLWNSVADDADCTCCPATEHNSADRCPECEAMAALGLGDWVGADAAAGLLGTMERRLGGAV